MSTWSSQPPAAESPTSPTFAETPTVSTPTRSSPTKRYSQDYVASPTAAVLEHYVTDSPPPSATTRERANSRPSSRPVSMVYTYQPPLMEVAQDTLPELQPIFTFLNSHSNKLYQEGYFLKLHDLDARTSWHAHFSKHEILTTGQVADPAETGHGPNASHSLLAQSYHFGTPHCWMLPARMERSCLPLSIWQMHQSRWCVRFTRTRLFDVDVCRLSLFP